MRNQIIAKLRNLHERYSAAVKTDEPIDSGDAIDVLVGIVEDIPDILELLDSPRPNPVIWSREPTNAERAARAAEAVDGYNGNDDLTSAINDLLTDIRHLLDDRGFDPNQWITVLRIVDMNEEPIVVNVPANVQIRDPLEVRINDWVLKTASGNVVRVGDHALDHRGETAVISGGAAPLSSNSTGKVYTDRGVYYPGVFDMHWERG
jgi:hypothetical protein